MNNPALWFIASALWWFVAKEKIDIGMTTADHFFYNFFGLLSLIFLIAGFIQWMR